MSERTRWQKIARRIRVPLGFVFAGVFLWLARPTWLTMLASLVLVGPGVWLRRLWLVSLVASRNTRERVA